MARETPNSHLTDAEFTDLLLGSIPPSVTAHLESCATCAEEARSISGAILNFEEQSRAWAERRAAGQTALVAPAARRFPGPALPGFGFAWQAVAAVTLVCAGMTAGYRVAHHAGRPAAVSSAHSAVPQVAPSTLKADNELLSAIAGELQAEVAPPPSVYGLDVSEHPSHSHRVKRMMN